MPVWHRLLDIYLSCLGLGFGSVSTRGCGWRLPDRLITTGKFHYQTLVLNFIDQYFYPTGT